MPKRIQRKRTQGWQMPEGTVYVGRPTKWGNPYRVGEILSERHGGPSGSDWLYAVDRGWVGQRITTEMAVTLYRLLWSDVMYYGDDESVPIGLFAHPTDLRELTGKDLACWCPLDQPCHADVLLELANQ